MNLAPEQARRILRGLLALIGSTLLLAAIPLCFPVAWMETIHQAVGLGKLPSGPIVVYLARSTSALYALHGSVLVYTSWHFARLHPLVPCLGWLHVVFGLVMLAIDVTTPMPWHWTACEGLPVSLVGGLLLWLYRRSGAARAPLPAGSAPTRA